VAGANSSAALECNRAAIVLREASQPIPSRRSTKPQHPIKPSKIRDVDFERAPATQPCWTHRHPHENRPHRAGRRAFRGFRGYDNTSDLYRSVNAQLDSAARAG